MREVIKSQIVTCPWFGTTSVAARMVIITNHYKAARMVIIIKHYKASYICQELNTVHYFNLLLTLVL